MDAAASTRAPTLPSSGDSADVIADAASVSAATLTTESQISCENVYSTPKIRTDTNLASVLEDKDDINGASEMRQKSFDLETDPIKKAKIKLKFAQAAKGRGQLSKARSLAREAIRFNPNFGKAYLFIAKLYQTSVNKCGKNEFEKRMVYVAALKKAIRAASLDPSISGIAKKYIRSYKANIPSQKVIFTAGVNPGSSYQIKCRIGETVKVPLK